MTDIEFVIPFAFSIFVPDTYFNVKLNLNR